MPKFWIYDVVYKTPCDARSLRIIFDKVNGLSQSIKYNSTKYLALLHSDEKYESDIFTHFNFLKNFCVISHILKLY